MFEIPYLSQHKRHTTIKPGKIQKLFRPKIPNKSLTHPTGEFWSIFFTKLSGYLNHTQLSRLYHSKMILGLFDKITFFGPDPLLIPPSPRWLVAGLSPGSSLSSWTTSMWTLPLATASWLVGFGMLSSLLIGLLATIGFLASRISRRILFSRPSASSGPMRVLMLGVFDAIVTQKFWHSDLPTPHQ